MRTTYQFSLASLMLIVIWLAVGLAIARVAPLLGTLYFLATLPALVRTCRCVIQRKRHDLRVDTQWLLRTFIQSTETIVLLTATCVAVLAIACLAAFCWGLVIATQVCRLVAWSIAHLARPIAWLLPRAVAATSRCAVALGRAFRRPRTIILRGPWRVAALSGSLCSAALLLGLMTVVWLVRLASEQIARRQRQALGMRTRVLLWTNTLAALARRLLASYRTVGNGAVGG